MLKPQLHPDVRRALVRLYKVFARYKLREPILCEMTDRVIIDTGRQLCEFRHEDFSYYSSKAMSTLGTREDFKHFLPRLLELAADPDPPLGFGFELGGLLMKLEYGECRKWPEAEQAALLEFFSTGWRVALTVPGLRSPVGEWLEGIALLITDPTPFLREWQGTDDAAALGHLREFIGNVAHGVRKHKSPPARLVYHWINLDPTPLMRWLIDPATEASLEAAFFRHADEPVAQEISRAIEELRWLRPGLAEQL